MDSASILLFAYGNPSRGDDALAPSLLEHIQQANLTEACGYPLRFLLDYQIQIEHVIDLEKCTRVILIDADQSIDCAFRFCRLSEKNETRYTTHGMTPPTLLHLYRSLHLQSPPLTAMLSIRGHSFRLGEGLSELAQENLTQAAEFLHALLSPIDFSKWDAVMES